MENLQEGVQWEVLDFQVPVANLQIFLTHHYKKMST